MKTKAQLKKVLFFNWKDIKHPQAGGAEIITHQLAKRLVIDGHTVTLITAKYNNSLDREYIDGVEVIRVGKNRFFHYSAARKYYLKNLKNQYDVIIEEVNTIPYFINLIKGNEKVFLFYHQLAGPVWFKEMFQPLSTFGFLLEPIYTYIQAKFSDQTITVSNSSKEDLVRHGFDSAKIHIISEGLENKPLRNISESLPKEKIFTILFHSSLRAMKRPMEVLKVFSIFSKKYPDSQLWISGGGNQKMLKKYATQNGFINQVKFLGEPPTSKSSS
ncbi:glycosyltransferase family 4 protein [Candidatus Gracilibacteria bacterium]|nr:glycosyltransferase family 4 protein [Candidatus Gracilibacteria bacterium]NJS41545.1 glycosyltransferase family 4 protein [Candidatus Gracilibacteria bacterium]